MNGKEKTRRNQAKKASSALPKEFSLAVMGSG